MHLGFGELFLIFLVVLLIFGSSKLPQLGDALGKSIKNFKKATTPDDSVDVSPKKLEGTGPAPSPGTASAERTTAQKK
jgi:sec-independent protein translocase protein TatA